jgi:hypothetical protein
VQQSNRPASSVEHHWRATHVRSPRGVAHVGRPQALPWSFLHYKADAPSPSPCSIFPVAAEAREPPSSPSSAVKQSPLLHCFPLKFLSHRLSGPHPKPSYAGPCLQPPPECRLRRCQVLRHRWPNPVSSGTPSTAKIEPWLHPLPLGALSRLPCHRECCRGRVAATVGELLALGRCHGEDSSPSD